MFIVVAEIRQYVVLGTDTGKTLVLTVDTYRDMGITPSKTMTSTEVPKDTAMWEVEAPPTPKRQLTLADNPATPDRETVLLWPCGSIAWVGWAPRARTWLFWIVEDGEQ